MISTIYVFREIRKISILFEGKKAGSTVKGKNSFLMGANSFLSQPTLFPKGTDVH